MKTHQVINNFFLGTSVALTAVATGASLATGATVGALSVGALYSPLSEVCGIRLLGKIKACLGKDYEEEAVVISIAALQILHTYPLLLLGHTLLGIGSFSYLQAGICSAICLTLIYDDDQGYEILSILANKVDSWIKSMYPPVQNT